MTLEELTAEINRFRDERNWRQFHNPKDAAVSLALEAAEVLEHVQWKNGAELDAYAKGPGKEALGEELIDVLYWVLTMADDLQIDLPDAFKKKMAKNAIKYPVEKSFGLPNKYTEL